MIIKFKTLEELESFRLRIENAQSLANPSVITFETKDYLISKDGLFFGLIVPNYDKPEVIAELGSYKLEPIDLSYWVLNDLIEF